MAPYSTFYWKNGYPDVSRGFPQFLQKMLGQCLETGTDHLLLQ